ncbi:MAG: type I glyceraldehyde-3-phosphate dehydrogenase [Alphaproteobacteria bacterium]
MKFNVAINGFGRIGRLTLRAFLERKIVDFNIVAVNDLGDIKSNLHLLKYDSVHGTLSENPEILDQKIKLQNHEISFISESDPLKLPWKDMNVDLVIESTGIFTDKEKAELHIKAGAKKVLISAPSKNPDITVVFGINQNKIEKHHKIISNGSCTTNCLAPIASIIDNEIGIDSGYMTTVHSVTGDQNTIDTLHKDLRRARNALISIIPTSTGAARAVGEVLPNLKGKIDGSAIRVPTSNVSLVDFKFTTNRDTNVDEIKDIFKQSENKQFKSIIQTVDSPMVSGDFNHNPHSSIIDLSEIAVIQKRFCRVLSWYDNEWGFSNRLIDVIKKIQS